MITTSSLAQHIRLQESHRSIRREMNEASLAVAMKAHPDYFKGLGDRTSRGMALRNSLDQAEFFTESASLAQTQMQAQQESITRIHDLAQDLRDQFLSMNASGTTAAARVLGDTADDYYEQVRGALNNALGGRFVFGGPATANPPLRAIDEPNASGLSPHDAIEQIRSNYNLGNADAMTAFLDEVGKVFDGTHPNPDYSFDNLFYAGSTSGTRMTAMIDQGLEVSPDTRANEPAFRDVLEVLTVLQVMPLSSTSEESLKVMANRYALKLTEGIGSAVDLRSAIGKRQELVKDTIELHNRSITIANNAISDLESIDEYAYSTRFTNLQSQVEISYTLTAKLNALSLVNYIR